MNRMNRDIFKKQEENFDDYRNHEVDEDDISVIFLKCEDLEEKMKIFEDLNTYAKRQSKDVEIFGSVVTLGMLLLQENLQESWQI